MMSLRCKRVLYLALKGSIAPAPAVQQIDFLGPREHMAPWNAQVDGPLEERASLT